MALQYLKSLLSGKKARRQQRDRLHDASLSLEMLEDKVVLDATVSLAGSILSIDAVSATSMNLTLSQQGTSLRIESTSGPITNNAGASGQVISPTVLLVDSASFNQITATGTTNVDIIDVDFSGGNPIPSMGMTFDGAGGATDLLRFSGASVSNVSGQIDVSSVFTVNGLATPATFTTTNVETISDDLTAQTRNFSIVSAGNDTIILSNPAIVGTSRLLFGSTGINFNNPTSALTIDMTGNGLDSLSVRGVSSTFDADLTIIGGTTVGDLDQVIFDTEDTFIGTGTLSVNSSFIRVNGVQVETSGQGDISLTAAQWIVVEASSGVSTTEGDITMIAGSLTLPDPLSDGIRIENSSITSTAGGNISINGTSISNGEDGVSLLTATISTVGSGTISINGSGNNATADRGVEVENTQVTSVDGNITIIGNGLDSDEDMRFVGVSLVQSTGLGSITIQSDGAVLVGGNDTVIETNLGDIDISGNLAGASTGNVIGVQLINQAVRTTAGSIRVRGRGGDFSSTNSTIGVSLGGSVTVSSLGSGSIEIEGTGGTNDNLTQGVLIGGQITNVDGDIRITGNGGGSGSSNGTGVFVLNTISTSGAGSIEIIGNGAAGTGSDGVFISLAAGRNITTAGTGDITLTGTATVGSGVHLANGPIHAAGGGTVLIQTDTILLAGTSTISGTSDLSIQPITASTTIGLGGGAGTLNLDDAEIAKLVDGFSLISIGSTTNTGAVTIDSATFLDPIFIGGGSIAVGGLTSAGNAITLTANTGDITDVSAVNPEVLGSSVSFNGRVVPSEFFQVTGDAILNSGDTFETTISGTTAGTDYGQLVVTGVVTLANAHLSILGGFTPTAGDVFTLVDNDGTDAVIGTFGGLAEGSIVLGAFGGGLRAQISYVGGDGNDVVLTIIELDDGLVVGQGTGGSTVRVFDAQTGVFRSEFEAYPGFTGGVNVALADLNNDGIDDIITGAAAGGGPHVKVFDGVTLAELRSFFAYDPAFTGGVWVAAGDIDGDGDVDIVTGAGAGGGPHVKAFDFATLAEVRSFFAYDPAFAGGVHVATGDVDNDGIDDIITGAGAGGGPHVKAFSGVDASEIRSFFAYDPAFAGGVFVAAGQFNTGADDIVTGAGPGGGPHVKVFDGATLAELQSFFAYDAAFSGGVRVGSSDIDGNNSDDIITGAGPGGGPHVRAFDGITLAELDSFFAFDSSFPGGVTVAGGFLGTPLRASSLGSGVSAQSISTDDLSSFVDSAIARWKLAGISESALDRLADAQIDVVDLPGTLLGLSSGNRIWIDEDAAGHGWSLDGEDQDRIDLLTAVAHEMGHLLGLPDLHDAADELMSSTLGPGEVR